MTSTVKILRALALALALPLAAVAQTGYIHGNGDPRVTGRDCGQSRFYIDDTTNQMYVSGAGSPCLWTVPGAVVGGSSPINAQTATYQVLASDFAQSKTIVVPSGTFTITLVDVSTQPANGQFINVVQYGTGTVSIVRSGQNINGSSTNVLVLSPQFNAGTQSPGVSAYIVSDGSNYFASGIFNGITISGVRFGVGGIGLVDSPTGNLNLRTTQPLVDNNYDTGTASFRFKNAYYSGALFLSSTQTSVGCSTSGTAIFSQSFQGPNFKRVLIHLTACLGTSTYTYPTAFTNTPSCYASSNVACSVAGTISTTAVTVTGTTSTGSLTLEDY